MIEILWHGRGGQGAFTAARLLGAACSMREGRHALAFPSFGPERRGAPMRAFTKLDSRPIGDRSAIARADYVVYLDESLLGPGWEGELKPNGAVLVNSARPWADPRIVAIDADGISREVLGRAIPNTVFLGALAALCPEVHADEVREAIRQYMPEKLHAKNLAVVERVLETRDAWNPACRPTQAAPTCPDGLTRAAAEDAQLGGAEQVGPRASAVADASPAGTAADAMRNGAAPSRALLSCDGSPRVIPSLRSHPSPLDPAAFAHSTCYEAGHLVSMYAGWRSVSPVLDEAACTRCLLCYMQCPDGTVYKVADEAARGGIRLQIDYDFCKGCGVCAKACRAGAIQMAPECDAVACAAGAQHKEAR